jgi:LPS-assembly lipoprotein
MQNTRSKQKPAFNIVMPVIFSLVLSCCFVLSACSFQLRGTTDLSFKSIYIQGSTLSISRALTQSFKSNGIKVLENMDDAELFLEMLNEVNEKKISALSGGGEVREYDLEYRVNFRTREPTNPIWSAPQAVQLRRRFSYNDNELLGKLDEEARLNNDMRNDAVREILRRLSAIKLTPK